MAVLTFTVLPVSADDEVAESFLELKTQVEHINLHEIKNKQTREGLFCRA